MALVELAPAVERESAATVELVGEIRAWRQAAISAEVAGRVTAIERREGARVAEKDPVVQLDAQPYAIAAREAEGRLKRAKAEKEKARLAWGRARKLYKQGVVSEEAKQNAHLALSGADAELTLRLAENDRATLNVERCTVTAPFAGLVASLAVDVGQWVKGGEALFEVVDIALMEARFEAPARSVGSLQVGMTSPVTVDGVPGVRFDARIIAVAPKADERTRTFLVKMRIENPDAIIRSGMVARTRLALSAPTTQVMIPRDAIVWRGPKALVFTIDDKGAARPIEVTLGRQEGGLVAELSGRVKPGRKLVVTGNEILREGALVTVTGERP